MLQKLRCNVTNNVERILTTSNVLCASKSSKMKENSNINLCLPEVGNVVCDDFGAPGCLSGLPIKTIDNIFKSPSWMFLLRTGICIAKSLSAAIIAGLNDKQKHTRTRVTFADFKTTFDSQQYSIVAVWKDNYVIYACVLYRMGKWSGFCESRDVILSSQHVFSIQQNDITGTQQISNTF